VKKSPEEQKHFTQSRKGLEGAKKTRQFFFARLCVLAPWRELFDFFTRSKPWGEGGPADPSRSAGPWAKLFRSSVDELTYSTSF
jgi:hypothetical protein